MEKFRLVSASIEEGVPVGGDTDRGARFIFGEFYSPANLLKYASVNTGSTLW